MSRILVIDDDMLVRRSLSRLFTDKGHDVLLAENLAQGVAAAETGVDIVYLDLDLPDGDGLRAIDELGMSPWRPEVIVITGMGAHYGAQRTMESNAWDYLSKPATPQKVIDSLESALTYRREVKNRPVAAGTPDKLGILGESSVMRRTMAEIGKTAASDAAVLIRGETGVGKELAARAIHENSRKRKGPFVVVDCSNLSESLVESILYGHAKGAYTGAHLSRMGLIAEADGGTLFLDEVGELPLSLQKSFLRVLQERSFRPLGDNREQTSDFRLVAATNKDLDKMVERSLFRSDLLFRLRTVELTLPPLRDRGDDRKLLARHFVDLTCKRYAITPVKVISDALLQVVLDYSWPG
ncbi:MAG: sigma-54-dependent Fis family transcriptional regulator, partial [Desulfofustis sp.]|nr:sigma-54-dependent Fis family transcriptional regulator [Desulfofustis sp.]